VPANESPLGGDLYIAQNEKDQALLAYVQALRDTGRRITACGGSRCTISRREERSTDGCAPPV
jgi:hypothetical protein